MSDTATIEAPPTPAPPPAPAPAPTPAAPTPPPPHAPKQGNPNDHAPAPEVKHFDEDGFPIEAGDEQVRAVLDKYGLEPKAKRNNASEGGSKQSGPNGQGGKRQTDATTDTADTAAADD